MPVIRLLRSSICLFRILYLFRVFFWFFLASSSRRVVYLMSSLVFCFFLRNSSNDWLWASKVRNTNAERSRKLRMLFSVCPCKIFGYLETNFLFVCGRKTAQPDPQLYR